MADFKTHITTSTVLGVAYGGSAYAFFDLPLPSCLLAAGLAGVSGMLPDIDSDSGVPLRESLAFASAVVPMMLIERLRQFELSGELIVLAGAAMYLAVRFGVGWLLARFTVHRGMFHSFPAAAVFGEVAFLLATGSLEVRLFKAGAVVLGFVSHLALDEFYSVRVTRGRVKIKKSLGTAMKFFGPKPWPNLLTWGGLGILSCVAFLEPSWMENWTRYRVEQLQAQGVLPADFDAAQPGKTVQALEQSLPPFEEWLSPPSPPAGTPRTAEAGADLVPLR
jgi:hypothetical protein